MDNQQNQRRKDHIDGETEQEYGISKSDAYEAMEDVSDNDVNQFHSEDFDDGTSQLSRGTCSIRPLLSKAPP